MHSTLPDDPYPQPVGLVGTDMSPYGVRDMAGGARCWVDEPFNPKHRCVRGGAYSLYSFFSRAASRWGHSPHATLPNVGIRLVKELMGG